MKSFVQQSILKNLHTKEQKQQKQNRNYSPTQLPFQTSNHRNHEKICSETKQPS